MTTSGNTLLAPLDRPTMSIEEAGHLLGISRCSAYRAANTGELPVIKVGRRLMVPTAVIRRMLHLDDAPRGGDGG